MKLFLLSAAAALIIGAPAAFADPPDHHSGKPRSHSSSESHNSGTSHRTPHATAPKARVAPKYTPYVGSGGGGIHTPQTMQRTTRYRGKVTTTMSPATVYNNAVTNRNRRNRSNRNYNYRNNTHVHVDFNRRNVTARRHYRYHGGSWHWPSGYSYRRWSYGMVLPSLFWGRDYWIDDYYDYGLGYPPPGTVWIRYGDDAILIDRYTGEILEVVYDQFD